MTQDEIIRMAREVWGERAVLPFNDLERFAALVAAHEREKHNSPSWETVDDAIAAEREACAKVCDEVGSDLIRPYAAEKCAAAIRSRNNAN